MTRRAEKRASIVSPENHNDLLVMALERLRSWCRDRNEGLEEYRSYVDGGVNSDESIDVIVSSNDTSSSITTVLLRMHFDDIVHPHAVIQKTYGIGKGASDRWIDEVAEELETVAAPVPDNRGWWWADENYYPIRPLWQGEYYAHKPKSSWTLVDGVTGDVVNESVRSVMVEGGAVGHLQHLYDNRDLTFVEMKDIIATAGEGRLEKATEKLDGMNCVFSWNEAAGELKVARSAGDIKRGGMDAVQLAEKFKDRGNLTDAFNGSFKVLSDAIGALPPDDRLGVFGPSANFWYSVEIIYTANPNVVNYDGNNVVFHGWPVFEADASGEVSKGENERGVEILSRNVERMQKAVTLRNWAVRGPAVVKLKKLSDGSTVSDAIRKIEQAQSTAGVGDDATIGDYLRSLMREEVADLRLPPKAADAVVERALSAPGAPTLIAIKKMVPQEQYSAANDFVKSAPILLKKMIRPLEAAIQTFAAELLKGLHSSLVGNHDAEIVRLRKAVETTAKAIEAGTDQNAMDVLKKQMEKLGSVENITTPVEGVVFIWKGNAYKFTGSFAAANQILGIFKYARNSAKPTTEALLREAERLMLMVEYVELLSERDKERGLGNIIAADEMMARSDVEAARKALADYKAQLSKKITFFKACQSLGIKQDSSAARKLKKEKPDLYSYDASMLQKSQELLSGEIAKARSRLAKFDPEAVDYAALAALGAKKAPESGVALKAPERNKKSYIKVDKLQPLTLYHWSDKRWHNATKDIPLGFGKDEGSHPGEDRLATILGGQVQGDNVSFDIVTSNGWRWEVKGIRSLNDQIRPGTLGLRAVAGAVKALGGVCAQLADFVFEVKDLGVDTITSSDIQRGMFAIIDRFVDDELGDIEGGEVSYERFVAFRRALMAASKLKQEWKKEIGELSPEMLRILGKDVKLSREKYVDVARHVHKASPEARILDAINERERALLMLTDQAFDNPDTWLNAWDHSIDVTKIFSDVSGLFIVTPAGFYKVPRSKLADVLVLKRISKGMPRYAVEL